MPIRLPVEWDKSLWFVSYARDSIYYCQMLYAAYGSNLHPLRLQQRTPSAQLVGTSEIAHYSLRFHKRGYRDFSGKCNLIWQKDKTAFVAIYNIDKNEIPLLDRAEGVGAGYDKTLIAVEGFGDCIVYLATSTHIDDSLLPFSWYKALVIAGCERLMFPVSYVESIRAVAALKDTDYARHKIHMQLIEQCDKIQR